MSRARLPQVGWQICNSLTSSLSLGASVRSMKGEGLSLRLLSLPPQPVFLHCGHSALCFAIRKRGGCWRRLWSPEFRDSSLICPCRLADAQPTLQLVGFVTRGGWAWWAAW